MNNMLFGSGQFTINKKINYKTICKLLNMNVKANNHLEKGLKLFHAHKYEKALKEFNVAIKREPDNIIVYLDKGALLNCMGRYKEAIEIYNIFLQYDPEGSPAYYNKGIALYNLSKYQESIESFDVAINLYSKMDANNYLADAYIGKGKSLWKIDKLEEALDYFNLAIQTNPSSSEAYYYKGNVLTIMSKPEKRLYKPIIWLLSMNLILQRLIFIKV